MTAPRTAAQAAARAPQEPLAGPGQGHGIGQRTDAPDAPTTPRRGISALPGMFLFVDTLWYHLKIHFRITPKGMRPLPYRLIRTRRSHGSNDFNAFPRPASRRFIPCRNREIARSIISADTRPRLAPPPAAVPPPADAPPRCLTRPPNRGDNRARSRRPAMQDESKPKRTLEEFYRETRAERDLIAARRRLQDSLNQTQGGPPTPDDKPKDEPQSKPPPPQG